MDKYEYQVHAAEIKDLIAQGEFKEAVAIADSIDWRRVQSATMLCTISDLYKINGRYQESKDILLMAYDRRPNSRLILYSLCQLSIKLGEVVQAWEYYKAFTRIAPMDSGKYILKYRLFEAQDVSLEERIELLEEFREVEPREKWLYELALLYHKVGRASDCVAECDSAFTMFGEGKYVMKALELKMLHTPLEPAQQLKYDLAKHGIATGIHAEGPDSIARVADIQSSADTADLENSATKNISVGMGAEDIQVKIVDVGACNTVNLQGLVAEGMQGLTWDDAVSSEGMQGIDGDDVMLSEEVGDSKVFGEDPDTGRLQTMQWGQTQNIRLSGIDLGDLIDEADGGVSLEALDNEELTVETEQAAIPEEPEQKASINIDDYISTREAKHVMEQMKHDTASLHALAKANGDVISKAKEGVLTPLNTGNSPFDKMLSQENDGQIKLSVPDDKIVEKQITGQMSIKDVLTEWEEMKKENEQKRQEEVRQRIIQHTGRLFEDFEKDGLLEQLEKSIVEVVMKESKLEKGADLDAEIEREVKLAANRIYSKMAEETNSKSDKSGSDTEEADDIAEADDGVEELVDISTDTDDEAEDDTVRMLKKELEEHEREDKQKKADQAKKNEKARKTEKKKKAPSEAKKEGMRELSEEEKQLFAPYLKHKKMKDQLIYALDNISMAACTGNVLITGDEGVGTIQLAKELIKEIQATDSNFLGHVAKITGKTLNRKNIPEVLEQLKGGAMIIEKASGLTKATAGNLVKALNNENIGIIVFLEDSKKAIGRLSSQIPELPERFNIRLDIEALGDEALVEYAKEYAEGLEYSMDDLAVLALHLRIENMQTSDHDVTLSEVREIVDEAIYYADRKTPAHLMDVMLGKRYDNEDMIVLREKDFMHNV